MLDLAVVNSGSNTLSVLLGQCAGTFAAKVDYPTDDNPQSIALADLNGDQLLDAVVASYQFPGAVSVLMGRGEATFAPAVDYVTGYGTTSVAIADFNGDGWLDLAVAHAGSVGILLGRGDGVFAPMVDYKAAYDSSLVAIADLNGDGKLDLAVANSDSDSVSVFLDAATAPSGQVSSTGPPTMSAVLRALISMATVDLT